MLEESQEEKRIEIRDPKENEKLYISFDRNREGSFVRYKPSNLGPEYIKYKFSNQIDNGKYFKNSDILNFDTFSVDRRVLNKNTVTKLLYKPFKITIDKKSVQIKMKPLSKFEIKNLENMVTKQDLRIKNIFLKEYIEFYDSYDIFKKRQVNFKSETHQAKLIEILSKSDYDENKYFDIVNTEYELDSQGIESLIGEIFLYEGEPYKFIKKLGSGGSGSVFLIVNCYDDTIRKKPKKLALKFFNKSKEMDAITEYINHSKIIDLYNKDIDFKKIIDEKNESIPEGLKIPKLEGIYNFRSRSPEKIYTSIIMEYLEIGDQDKLDIKSSSGGRLMGYTSSSEGVKKKFNDIMEYLRDKNIQYEGEVLQLSDDKIALIDLGCIPEKLIK